MKKYHFMNSPWLILLLATDLFFSFLVWLTNPQAFGKIIVILLLFSACVLLTGCRIDQMKRRKRQEALRAFLRDPGEETQGELLAVAGASWHPVILTAVRQLREQERSILEKQLEIKNYQEFIEAWAHEIKTPLSLATMLLDNHADEMSSYVLHRMEHVRHAVSHDVDLVLYYARLHVDHMDYHFEKLELGGCVRECLRDFHAIAEEKGVSVRIDLPPLPIVSDRKVLLFMLSQLLSNALKYAPSGHGVVCITGHSDGTDGKKRLIIRDNGPGASPEDLPFLFDKGFTGNHPGRQHATGMGLYLVKKYAGALSAEISIIPQSAFGHGFGIELAFPHVSQEIRPSPMRCEPIPDGGIA